MVLFIPLHIIFVNIIPLAPTREPLMIKELFNKTKPVVAAANPEKELSKEITTGISAPPIGITPKQPNNNEIQIETITTDENSKLPKIAKIPPITIIKKSNALIKFWPLNFIADPPIIPCSFPNATILPVRVNPPIKIERRIAKKVNS